MANHDSYNEIRAKIADANEFLRALESANLYIGVPLENSYGGQDFRSETPNLNVAINPG